MKERSKSYMLIVGTILIVLGISCIVKPGILLSSFAWLIGFLMFISGISALLVPKGRMPISAVFQILVGVLCFKHSATAGAFLGFMVGGVMLLIGLIYIGILLGVVRMERNIVSTRTNEYTRTTYDPDDNTIDEQ